MTREELIEKIKAYVSHKGWHSGAFAIDGVAGDYLLGDTDTFPPSLVMISLSKGNCHAQCDDEFDGLRFVAVTNHAGWANIHQLPNVSEFLVSTRARIERRMKKECRV